MKKGIHPEYKKSSVNCMSCGNTFDTHSTVKEIKVDVCYNCHPFYTGQKFGAKKAGRIDRFNKRIDKKDIKE